MAYPNLEESCRGYDVPMGNPNPGEYKGLKGQSIWPEIELFDCFFRGNDGNNNSFFPFMVVYLLLRIGVYIFDGAQAGGRTKALLVSVYFLSFKQYLRPLGYCAPLSGVFV